MYEYLPRLQQMLFAPTASESKAFLVLAVDLEDLERREAALEEELRRNMPPAPQH
jgi:hypothetical protein